MALADWAPKRRDHKAEVAAIEDLNDPPPAFLTRQDNGLPRASSLPAALDNTAQDLDALQTALQGELPLVYPDRKPTDLEQIAWWGKYLTYTDMKKFATEVLSGKTPTTPSEFADLFEEWCRKNTEPPQTEESPQ